MNAVVWSFMTGPAMPVESVMEEAWARLEAVERDLSPRARCRRRLAILERIHEQPADQRLLVPVIW